jgi:Septum formation
MMEADGMAAPAGLSGPASEPAAGEPPGAEVSVPQQAEVPARELATAAAPAGEPLIAEAQAGEPSTAEEPAREVPAAAAGETAAGVTEPEPDPEVTEAGYTGERRRTNPVAVIGVIFSILVLAVAALVVLAIVTHGFKPKTVVTYRPAAVFRLQPGDCINSSQNGLAVTILSCATPHEAEVFATFSLAGKSWPGSAAAQQEAGNGCASRIGGYLNPQLITAGLSQQYVFPDQKAWQAGVHTVICEVSSSSGPLTGSVRQSG